MQFRPLALMSAILVGLAGASASAWAVSMDPVQSSSFIGQPYSGRLLLRGAQDLDPRASCVRVSDIGGDLPGLGPTRVSVKAGNEGWIVQLRSEQRINEPAVQFLVTFNCYGQKVSREYSVLLDLPAEVVPQVSEGEAASGEMARADQGTASPAVSPAVTTSKPPRKKRSARNGTRKASSAAASGSSTQYRASTAPRTTGQRDAVKLAINPGAAGITPREAELMAQAEDQAAQLRQLEMRIVELQAMIEKMRVYIPAEDLARLNMKPSSIDPAREALASGAAASPVAASAAAASAVLASVAQASAVVASTPVASAAAASGPAASAPAAADSDGTPFDWMFWVWLSAAGLAIFAFLAYVVRQKRIERRQAWGSDAITEEMVDSYAPARRAEVIARLNAQQQPAEEPFADDTPIPASAPPVAVVEAPVREAAVEFVDVQHSASAQEEAEWLISHGESERAIALLREEIRNNPDQTELWLMLFKVLYDQKKNLEFVTLAHRFRRQATGSEAWKEVCDLGLKLDPENRLFLTRNH